MAYQEAGKFTRPFVLSLRLGDGRVVTSIGAYVLIGNQWALTAGHIIGELARAEGSLAKWTEYEAERHDLETKGLEKGQLKARVRKLQRKFDSENLVQNLSVWLGNDAVGMEPTGHLNVAADIAAFQITKPDALWPD